MKKRLDNSDVEWVCADCGSEHLIERVRMEITTDKDDAPGDCLNADDNEFLDDLQLTDDLLKLLYGYFGPNESGKVNQWIKTPNPMLGNIEPLYMLKTGRQKRLLKIVKAMLEGNKPEDKEG